MATVGRKHVIPITDFPEGPVRDTEIKRRSENAEAMRASRQRSAEKKRLQATLDAAAATALVEKEQNASQKELYKRLLDDGHSADEISTWENEENLALLFIAATVQATGFPVSLKEKGKRHIWFIGDLREANCNEVLHKVEPESLEILAHDQVHFAEVVAKVNYLAKQKAAGLVPEGKHLLSEKWQSMAGDVASRRLKAIEDCLTANGITDLWKPEDSNLDPDMKSRPWKSWTWLSIERCERPQLEPRSAPMTIPPPSMVPPEPDDISKTDIVLPDGVRISLPSFPSSRM
jgi:hypothetical protein